MVFGGMTTLQVAGCFPSRATIYMAFCLFCFVVLQHLKCSNQSLVSLFRLFLIFNHNGLLLSSFPIFLCGRRTAIDASSWSRWKRPVQCCLLRFVVVVENVIGEKSFRQSKIPPQKCPFCSKCERISYALCVSKTLQLLLIRVLLVGMLMT